MTLEDFVSWIKKFDFSNEINVDIIDQYGFRYYPNEFEDVNNISLNQNIPSSVVFNIKMWGLHV